MSDEATNETLRQLSAQLGRVEGRLEGIETEQKRVAGYARDISTRVGALERRDARLLAVAGTLSAGVSLLTGWARSLWPGGS